MENIREPTYLPGKMGTKRSRQAKILAKFYRTWPTALCFPATPSLRSLCPNQIMGVLIDCPGPSAIELPGTYNNAVHSRRSSLNWQDKRSHRER